MPEGPDVKILTECLDEIIKGNKIREIKIISGRYIRKEPEGYKLISKELPLKILSVKCKGKFIYFELENDWYIFNTLGMTGTWKFTEDTHTRFIFTLDKIKLYYTDIRNFGTFSFKKGRKELDKKLNSLGLDVFKPKTEFTEDNFINVLEKNKEKTLPELLMNQKNYAGIGNYIKSECLYHAELSPHRLVKSLSQEEKRRLYKKIKMVVYGTYYEGNYYDIADTTGLEIEKLKESICKKRKIKPSELDLKKKPSKYIFQVYQLDKDKNGYTIIHEETKDKRTTHWVKEIQK